MGSNALSLDQLYKQSSGRDPTNQKQALQSWKKEQTIQESALK